MSGCLYIVPTPVGNLSDITFRAVETLKECDLILAEDTRTSSVLLKHYDIKTPMKSNHKYNEHQQVAMIAERVSSGEKIALISDAGTPGISDPGFMIVRECRKLGLDVTCLPGATAFVPALVGSGLPCDHFVFEGFLPLKKGRQTRLLQLAEETRTIIIYESPLRLAKTLKQLCEFFGETRNACVSREISKLHETFHRGSLKELAEFFSMNQAKGEIVIIVEGYTPEKGNREQRKISKHDSQ